LETPRSSRRTSILKDFQLPIDWRNLSLNPVVGWSS
jgi:hypothetical protein